MKRSVKVIGVNVGAVSCHQAVNCLYTECWPETRRAAKHPLLRTYLAAMESFGFGLR